MLDWQPVPEKLVLSDGTLDIWRFSLTQPSFKIQELAQLLCPEEQHRAERFYFQKDRLRFIACRGMLRKILGAYLEVEPSQLQFSYGKRGKPYLKGEQIHFNLSHSQNLALYAVTKNFPVGVDVEEFNQTKPVEQIAQRFFSPREQDIMSRLPPREKKTSFFPRLDSQRSLFKGNRRRFGRRFRTSRSFFVTRRASKLD